MHGIQKKKRMKKDAGNPDGNLRECPPGTTTPQSSDGSLHTCSDKLCRWNVVGLQGSLLASLLDRPLYAASLTVGRKFTACICARAVCCRVVGRSAGRNAGGGGKGTHEGKGVGTVIVDVATIVSRSNHLSYLSPY